ncbi:MAG: helix-turn-helix transcriptional regulator [Chloracidobacterium sp.]|nr:helix-turn-helix transcriptional regulator [Chloracidobacterium sp.]
MNKWDSISSGTQLARMETGGFIVTETRHRPSLVLGRHEHKHANINVTFAGSFRETIGKRPQESGPGSLLIKPPGEHHADVYGPGGAHSLIIEFPPCRIDTFRPVSGLLEKPEHIRNPRLTGIAIRIRDELHLSDPFSSLVVEGLIMELVSTTARVSSRESRVPPRWLTTARDLIHDRFSSPFGLSALAEAVGVHSAHLAREFRRHYGCPVGTYIRQLRLEFARQELLHSDKPLSVISASSGFYDQSQFTNIFKRHVGMTPSEYRFAGVSRNFCTKKH